MIRIVVGLVAVAALVLTAVWVLGLGVLGEDWHAGVATETPIPQELKAKRARTQRAGARLAGVEAPKQILFGDLHVHTTFSTDAFLMSLPMSGGDGARPVSDACDFARYCSELDFWSINDHALSITPRRWQETVESMRQCNAVSGDADNPDVVAYLGWEWTQVGTTPENHYGHKNVVLKHLDDARIPARPVSAGLPRGVDPGALPSTFGLGLAAAFGATQGGIDLVRYFREMLANPACPEGVPVHDLPADCIDQAPTPELLFSRLDEWGHEALVIPHGTTWGFYTPMASSWDKQLTASMHDPARQRLVEVYSGHGNSEEYRAWEEVTFDADGSKSCPEPSEDYLPSCWKAGEIIRSRCLEAGESEETCEARAQAARQNYVDADVSGQLTVPGQQGSDWGDSGQCRDCFLPAFNYRPRSSVQYMMALSSFDDPADPQRFRFGFMASSDVHSARPGTGYKEFLRREMTETRFGAFADSILARTPESDPEPESRPFDPAQSDAAFFGLLETERQSSFFLTGGLIAAHSTGRSREDIWDAMRRREVYGTSGPRILLWFDLVDPQTGDRRPMGSEAEIGGAPTFQVRALGSFEQNPGCPDYATAALTPENLERLCGGECYNPSGQRRTITRIEVVRIRPQSTPGESVDALIEDPWKVLPCADDPAGCRVTFSDPEFETYQRDTLYYARAIEAPSAAVNHDGVGCLGVAWEDDCLGEVEERAWSSPIFVDYARD
jgi:hypothetical protein